MEEEEPQEEDAVVEPAGPTAESERLETKPEEKIEERPAKRPRQEEPQRPATRPREEEAQSVPERPATRPAEDKAVGSLGSLGLSTKHLLKHEQYLEAVENLRNGKIQDHDFLALFSHKQKQGLYKHMEYNRSNADASEWSALEGQGVRKKTKPTPYFPQRRLAKKPGESTGKGQTKV